MRFFKYNFANWGILVLPNIISLFLPNSYTIEIHSCISLLYIGTGHHITSVNVIKPKVAFIGYKIEFKLIHRASEESSDD